jgi:hypothetical protein
VYVLSAKEGIIGKQRITDLVMPFTQKEKAACFYGQLFNGYR